MREDRMLYLYYDSKTNYYKFRLIIPDPMLRSYLRGRVTLGDKGRITSAWESTGIW